MRWWLGEDINQVRIEDLLDEMKGNENELSEINYGNEERNDG